MGYNPLQKDGDRDNCPTVNNPPPHPGLEQPDLDGDGFVERLLTVRSEFAVAERCKLKPVGFQLADDETWARVDFQFELAGRAR